MLDPAQYSAVETLRDGRSVEIRSYRPADGSDLEAFAGRIGPLSMYRRFFTLKQSFSEREKAFFLNVDFDKHIALVAVTDEGGCYAIIGGGRYVAVKPAVSEIAFVVLDQYQGQGLGAALLRHLITIARETGLDTLVAEVLRENAPMLKVFGRSGLPMTTEAESDVVHVTLQLRPLANC